MRPLSSPPCGRPSYVLCVALLALAGCGGGDDAAAGSASTAASTPSAAGITCKKVAAPEPKGAQHLSKPTATLPAGKRYDVDLQTNCGTITIRLATGRAPKTSASFADLVKRGFYDGLTFHRVVHDFVIQGGDPLGTGLGGPGYTVVEKPPADTAYTTGVVAMAKTEADPSGASGSQFFIVTAPDAGLPPDYAVAGGVVRGHGRRAAHRQAPGRRAGPPDLARRHREGDAQNRVSRGSAGSRQSGSSWRASLTASPTARMPVCSSGAQSSSSPAGVGAAVQPRVLGLGREHHRHAVVDVGELLGGRRW